MDYIKLHINGIDTQRLLAKLDFMRLVNTDTGTYQNQYRKTSYHHCTIKINDNGLVEFSGSVHKMWNSLKGIKAPNVLRNTSLIDKGYNGNDITFADIQGVRDHLAGLFDCEPSQMVFRNIEIGINIVLPFFVVLFLKGLLYHHGKRFEHSKGGRLWKCRHYNYILKIYDKGHQYGMEGNVLRVEVQVKRMTEIQATGLKTFADIDPSTLESLCAHLQQRFSEVVYYDSTIDKERLTGVELVKIKDYSNPNYWMELESRKRDRHKKKLTQIIAQKSQNLKDQIQSLIWAKCVIIHSPQNDKVCNNSHFKYTVRYYTPTRFCLVTGLDISVQKKESRLLSNTGLKKLEKNNPKAFNCLKQILLTGQPNKFETNIYDRMSKQIRNKCYNNPSRYSQIQTTLFS